MQFCHWIFYCLHLLLFMEGWVYSETRRRSIYSVPWLKSSKPGCMNSSKLLIFPVNREVDKKYRTVSIVFACSPFSYWKPDLRRFIGKAKIGQLMIILSVLFQNICGFAVVIIFCMCVQWTYYANELTNVIIPFHDSLRQPQKGLLK